MSLTGPQETFAAGVAQGLSQAEAYRKAYPAAVKWKDATVWSRASELAADSKVLGRVQELLQKAAAANEVTVERVIREIARIGFFDIRKLVNPDGTPKPLHELDDDTAAAIAGLEVARVGNDLVGVGEVLKFKIADKNSALEKLGRHLGAFETDNKQRQQPGFNMQQFFADLLRAPAKPEDGGKGATDGGGQA